MKQIVEKFYKEHGFYPGSKDFKTTPGLPNIKQVERRGGIEFFYQSLGIKYEKKSKGTVRAQVASKANEYAYYSENDFYQELVDLYGELAVHRQSPYVAQKNNLCRADFKVYPKKGRPFFVDVFSASDMHNFSGCINIKLRKLMAIGVDPTLVIYFVSLNDEFITEHVIEHYRSHRKTPLPANIHIFTKADALRVIKKNL